MKAYQQFLLFDENYNFIGAESGDCECFKKVTIAAANGVETLSLEVDIEQDGYMYIYVANESNNDVNVWFDNLTVTHMGAKVVKTADYYPFGSVAKEWVEEDFRFGYQGLFAEADQETGLNYFTLRDYDSDLGRWLATDPYGQYWSPYAGMGNSPNMGVDPDGGWSWTTALIGAGLFGTAGAIYGLTQDKENWGWYAAGGFVGGGLLGGAAFNSGTHAVQSGTNTTLNWPSGLELSPFGQYALEVSLTSGPNLSVFAKNGGIMQNDPNADLIRIARSLSQAKGGEKWDDVIDPSIWGRYLDTKGDMGKGHRWSGKIGGIQVSGYSGSQIEFSQVRFYSPARKTKTQHYFKIIPENLKKDYFPLNNPVSGREFDYPYKIRVSGYFDQRPSQVMTFGFRTWGSFSVFSEIIMGIR